MEQKNVTSEMVLFFVKVTSQIEEISYTVIHMDNCEPYGLYVPDNKE